MPQLAIANMFLGFLILFISASAGAFIGFDITEAFLKDKEYLESWQLTLFRSAHGHFNLFGLIHIAFALTMPYSVLSSKVKRLQTGGLFLGALAMGPLLIWRAYNGPSESLDLNEFLLGIFLSCALASIASHAYGLGVKVYRRA